MGKDSEQLQGQQYNRYQVVSGLIGLSVEQQKGFPWTVKNLSTENPFLIPWSRFFVAANATF